MVVTLQVDAEIVHLANQCFASRPRRVLEIGCYQGGTLKLWLQRCGKDATVVAVDDLHINEDAYQDWTRPDTNLVVVRGVSQSADAQTQIREHAPYDWVFIDGDHGYHVVKADVDLCVPLVREGGFLAMHDIVSEDGGDYGPGLVLDELERGGYSVQRIVADDVGDYEGAHGIGVVRL